MKLVLTINLSYAGHPGETCTIESSDVRQLLTLTSLLDKHGVRYRCALDQSRSPDALPSTSGLLDTTSRPS